MAVCGHRTTKHTLKLKTQHLFKNHSTHPQERRVNTSIL